MRRLALALALVVCFGSLAAAATAHAPQALQTAARALTLVSVLAMVSRPCPPGLPPEADLRRTHRQRGRPRPRRSLGGLRVLGSRRRPYRCAEMTVRPEVVGKGELELAVDRYRGECIVVVVEPERAFTVTGGSGIYAGASGGARCHRALRRRQPRRHLDRHTECAWSGLRRDGADAHGCDQQDGEGQEGGEKRARDLPGHRSGRQGRRVVGHVPARSGSRFRIGRTVVNCTATDTSANTTNASFRVTVRRTR